MPHHDIAGARSVRYQLRFRPMRGQQSALAFPCNDRGCVDMDALGDAMLREYLYARAVVGMEYHAPRVESTVR